MNESKNNIVGAGGGGGGKGGGGGTVAPDTLASNSQVRVLFAIGEGEIGGLWTGDAQSILLDKTPVQNADLSYNFQAQNGSTVAPLTWVAENGTPSQPYVPGFSAAENYYAAGVQIFHTAPVVQATSGPNIDAMRCDIQIPSLYSADSNGNVNGTTVAFHFDTKLASGSTWTTVVSDSINAKSSGSTVISYLVPRPSGTGIWDVRIVRDSADNAGTTLQNLTYFNGYTEIQYVQDSYPNTALVGISLDAQSFGSSVPTVSFNVYGRKVRIPNNYNPVTRVYTGTWTGTFASTNSYTNNPAWVLYDLITESRAGLGVSDSQIDKFSFYNAAVYADAGIQYDSSGNYVGGGLSDGNGGFEPRYTFNGVLNQQVGSWDALNQIAAVMHGRLVTTGNLIKLVIDMPATPVALITNSNVINDGQTDFSYTSPSLGTAFTACQITYNDTTYNYLVKDILYTDTTTTLPYLVNQLNGFGITSEGQARRLAKWTVDTSLYSTLSCSFKVSYEFSDLEPFDVVKVMDSNVAGVQQEARIVSASAGTLVLDRAVTIGTGTWTIDAVGSDGVTIETATITSLSTTSATLTYTGTLTGAKNSTAIITGSVGAQYFRVLSIKEAKANEWDVVCTQYDANRYARVESGITVGTTPFFTQPTLLTISPVSGFTYKQNAALMPDGSINQTLDISWSATPSDYVVRYGVTWQKDFGAVVDMGQFNVQPHISIPLTADGVYQIYVVAYNAAGRSSVAATGSYTATLSAPSTTSSLPGTDLFADLGGVYVCVDWP